MRKDRCVLCEVIVALLEYQCYCLDAESGLTARTNFEQFASWKCVGLAQHHGFVVLLLFLYLVHHAVGLGPKNQIENTRIGKMCCFSPHRHILGFGYDCFLSIENQGNLQLHQSVQCVQFEHSHTPREQRKYRRKNRVPGVLL